MIFDVLRLSIALIVFAFAVEANDDDPSKKIELYADPGIQFGQLDNGLKYAVMRAGRPKNQADIQFYFNVGSLDEAEDERGLAHFLEHMAFNGSEKVAEDELIPLLQRLGLAFGADANAYTGFDRTVYTLHLPNLDTETVDTSFMLMREIAGNLTLSADAIDRERGIIESERRSRKGPGQKLGEERLNYFLAGSKFPQRQPIGITEVVETVSADTMRSFYHRYYRPENAFLVITGDFEPQSMIDRIKADFSDWKPVGEAGPKRTVGELSAPGGKLGSYFDAGLPFAVSYHGVKPKGKIPDSFVERRKNIIRNIANATLNRRLSLLAQAEDAVFLSGGTGVQPIAEQIEIASLSIAAEPDHWQDAFKFVVKEWRKAIQFGFEQTEIDEILAAMRVQLRQAQDNQDKRASASLANWLIASHASDAIPTRADLNNQIFEAAVATLTPEGARLALAEIWQDGTPRFFIHGQEAPEGFEQKYRETLADAFTDSITRNTEIETVTFAYTDFGEAGTIAERRFDEDLGATLVRFKNNVRLSIKETDFQEQIILSRLRFGTGLSKQSKDQAGLSYYLQPVVVGGGLGAHSAVDLSRILAGKTARLNLTANHEDFLMTAGVRPEDLLLQMQLWTALITDPGYRANGYAQFRRSLNAVYDTLDSTPQQVLSNKGSHFLANNDPRYSIPPREKIESYKIEDVRSFMEDSFQNGEIEISLVGNVDTEVAIKAVSETLAALPERRLNDAKLSPVWNLKFPKEKSAIFYHKGDDDQSILRLVWPGHNDQDEKQYVTGSLVRSLLQDKLRQYVREELGDAYSPSVSFSPSRFALGHGSMSVRLDLEPSRIDSVIETIQRGLAEIQAGAITEDDLARALKPRLTRFDAAVQENGYWFRLLSEAQSFPERVYLAEERKALYQSVSLADISDYARRWLDREQLIEIRVLPKTGVIEGG